MPRKSTTASRGWKPTAASARFSTFPRKDTSPELALRRALFALGARYRVHHRLESRLTVDIAFTCRKVALFVDGCFWHGCPRHGRKRFGGPNGALWRDKIRSNRLRDRRQAGRARELGWTVLRFWECDVLDHAERIARETMRLVRKRRGARVV